eukprot:Tamp_06938.p1 GENE.Tamp_06938~~Tamp_06938.p1  ORF type:complete len:854 (-),score=151.59 Tamp_06938:43-2232(-)
MPGGAGGMGADADMEEAQGALLGAGEKMVVMLPQGGWLPYGKDLVLKEDGMLHHADLAHDPLKSQWQPSRETLQAYKTYDQSWDAQKKWWAAYQAFARPRGMVADSPNVNVVPDGGQPTTISLFAFYHAVRARGGLHRVLATRCMSEAFRDLGMRWTPALAFEVRRLYVLSLYAWELKDLRGLDVRVNSGHELLFCLPVKETTALAAAAARSAPVPLDSASQGKQLGLAGVMGACSAGEKRIFERTCGDHSPEDAFERQKRLCRSLDSGRRGDVSWSLGVLAMSSWEAAKGIEPHVVLTDAISGALARYLRALLVDPAPLNSDRVMLVTAASSADNRDANIEAVLIILKNFTCAPQSHLFASYAYNGDLLAALGLCLIHCCDQLRLLTLEVLAHIALPPVASDPPMAGAAAAPQDFASQGRGKAAGSAGEEVPPPEWFVTLVGVESEVRMCKDKAFRFPDTEFVHACPLTTEIIEGLNTVGSPRAGTALYVTFLRVVALLLDLSTFHDAALTLLLEREAIESALADMIAHPSPFQVPAFDFIAAAAGPTRAFKFRLSCCYLLVSNLVQVLVNETKDGRPQQAYAARALACLLNTDSPVLKERLILEEQELTSAALSTNATTDVVTDLSHVLLYLAALRSGNRFKPSCGAAREAVAKEAAAAAATAAAARAAAVAAWMSVHPKRDDESEDEDGVARQPGARGSGKYRCGVCGQIKKGHVCPGYWVEGEPK